MELSIVLNKLSRESFEHSRPLLSKKTVEMELESCENGGRTVITLKVDTAYGPTNKERIKFSGEVLREGERENPFFNRVIGWYDFSKERGSLRRSRVDLRYFEILLEASERAHLEHIKKVLGVST